MFDESQVVNKTDKYGNRNWQQSKKLKGAAALNLRITVERVYFCLCQLFSCPNCFSFLVLKFDYKSLSVNCNVTESLDLFLNLPNRVCKQTKVLQNIHEVRAGWLLMVGSFSLCFVLL